MKPQCDAFNINKHKYFKRNAMTFLVVNISMIFYSLFLEVISRFIKQSIISLWFSQLFPTLAT